MEDNQEGHQTVYPVPGYDEIITRNQIDMLMKPGDLVIRNGDLALTEWGDLMLNDEYYHSFFKLVQEWRFNYPTLRIMFEAVFLSVTNIEKSNKNVENILRPPGRIFSQPMPAIDYDAYHKAIDQHGAIEVATGIYAGSVAMVLSKSLLAFKSNISANEDEWRKSAPLFNGCSVGQILEASANNVRHNDEWAKSRPPTSQQLRSIHVLATALNEPMSPNGSGHRLARDICPETLQLICNGNFEKLEKMIFMFAKNMMIQRQTRLSK